MTQNSWTHVVPGVYNPCYYISDLLLILFVPRSYCLHWMRKIWLLAESQWPCGGEDVEEKFYYDFANKTLILTHSF